MPFKSENYPEDWKDRIRPDILRRARYKCERCGVGQRWKGYRDPDGNFIHCDEFMLRWARDTGEKVITIHLAVAHLDHDTANNDYSNLMAMCQQCHNRHDAEFRKINRISR